MTRNWIEFSFTVTKRHTHIDINKTKLECLKRIEGKFSVYVKIFAVMLQCQGSIMSNCRIE